MIFKNKGMTLLEMVLVLLVVLAIVFVSTRYYIMGRTGARVTQAMSQIDAMLEAAHTWLLGNTGTFCGSNPTPDSSGVNCEPFSNCNDPICTQKLISAGLISQQLAKNPFPNTQGDKGKYISVNPDKNNTNQLEMTIYLPKQACNALLQRYKNKTVQPGSCDGKDGEDFLLHLFFE